ncbi:tryptophan halogenase family protein [Stakelama saccharophila]|uniref:Tryptophan halogenase family protein n=1 Tax=Stakelama saccharophila TaxID=3075605 RepID=A0ABZ0B4W1_9SPHN|nr:tryptophan halogenase family protein [Stakelama sp. W311]WNO52354.1 tryptophan halogenase family protein [Stakelama sp. W311]
MAERVRVTIVGGGTAGWMAAAALAALLPRKCAVTLIESEAIGIIGVGEATLPHLKAFNDRLGFNEAAFMAATRATYKLGIEFRDWARIGDSYIHPFGAFGNDIGGVGFHHYWHRARAAGQAEDLDAYSLPVVAARMARFTPADTIARAPHGFSHAYQFDSTLYAPYLRRFAEARGVERIEGKVVDVARHGESGDIRAVTLEDGRSFEGDLFLDCSGFRALLIDGVLEEPFEDWSRWLPCDRAAAVPCAVQAGPLLPYTSAIAMPSGWRWRIPLQHRVGNGYVYASGHCSDDEAVAAILGAIEGEPIAEPRILRFRAGRRRRGWVNNCVSVGLSGGFLEPLESTSIYLVQLCVQTLIELFPQDGVAAIDRDEFNRVLDLEYDRIRDFLILHYHATQRSDSAFWERMRTLDIPDSLAEKIELYRRRGRVAQYGRGLFLEPSWIAVYAGQRIVPDGFDQRAGAGSIEAVAKGMEAFRRRTAEVAAGMPGHVDYMMRTGAMAA